MSEDEQPRRGRPPKEAEENCLPGITPEEVAELVASAKKQVKDPYVFLEETAERFLMKREVLNAVFLKLITEYGSAKTLDGALKIVLAALKVFDSEQEFTKPLMKRAQELMGLRGDGGRPKQQVAGRGGSGPRALPTQSGGAPLSGTENDPAEDGPAGVVEAGPVGVPDGERPGDG